MFKNICSFLNIGVFTFSNISGHSFVPQQVPRSSLDDLWDLESQPKISKMGQQPFLIFIFYLNKEKLSVSNDRIIETYHLLLSATC